MPCRSDYLEPTACEQESMRVREFLREADRLSYDHDHPERNQGTYGKPETLDEDTARLCDWLRGRPSTTSLSLELQLWWKQHQAADARREATEAEEHERERLRKSAAAKLTPAERAAIGLRVK